MSDEGHRKGRRPPTDLSGMTDEEKAEHRRELERQNRAARMTGEKRAERAASQRAYQDMKKYGLSREEAEALRSEPCAICYEPGPNVIDHDHHTDEIRGVLCISCNAGVGNFYDNPDLLDAAKEYLHV